MKKVEEYNRDLKPRKGSTFVRLVTKTISSFALMKNKVKVEKVNFDKLKGPCLVLANHASFYDIYVTGKVIFPRRCNFVAAMDACLIAPSHLMRLVGGFAKRRYVTDLSVIKNMKYSLDNNKAILLMFPEARYSVSGTNEVLPDSIGKVIRMLKVPVLIMNISGSYMARPQWNKVWRDIPINVKITKILDPEDIKKMNAAEINETVKNNFAYNDWEYIKKVGYKLKKERRCDGINRILYKCPNCKKEHLMRSYNDEIWCDSCSKKWIMDENGDITAVSGDTEFTNVPDWYRWEREEVRKEIENGTYLFDSKVLVQTMPNDKKLYDQGEGHLVHDVNGFHFDCKLYNEQYHKDWSPLEQYTCHVEYNFQDKGDAIGLSVVNESFFMYPIKRRDVVTKVALAVEELYKIKRQEVIEKTRKKED